MKREMEKIIITFVVFVLNLLFGFNNYNLGNHRISMLNMFASGINFCAFVYLLSKYL